MSARDGSIETSRRDSFGRSLRFAALAALAWPASALLLAPALGAQRAFALHAAVCGALYLLRFGAPRLRALRERPLRAVAIEGALGAAGLALARAAVGPSVLAGGLALWAFWLVESAWFLGAVREAAAPPAAAGAEPDPFEEAARRAQRLLDDEAP